MKKFLIVLELATYKKFISHAKSQWSIFLARRKERLSQSHLNTLPEKISENILEDLFTLVMGWELENISYQVERSDMLLKRTGLKRAIIEVKRPGLLNWSRTEIEKALAQAKGYADEQNVKTIAISDGHILYAADILHGGLQERLHISLDSADFPEDLWWLSFHGVCKQRDNYEPLLNKTTIVEVNENELLHPKYKVPSRCFAYVGNHNQTKTWKLPYLQANGAIDTKRLSGAIRCIVTNYRGKTVKDIPESATIAVLKRLHDAAEKSGKLPHQNIKTPDTYKQLAEIVGNFKE